MAKKKTGKSTLFQSMETNEVEQTTLNEEPIVGSSLDDIVESSAQLSEMEKIVGKEAKPLKSEIQEKIDNLENENLRLHQENTLLQEKLEEYIQNIPQENIEIPNDWEEKYIALKRKFDELLSEATKQYHELQMYKTGGIRKESFDYKSWN